MFPEVGTVNSQQGQRQNLKPRVSSNFSKFRDLEGEDPISSFSLA